MLENGKPAADRVATHDKGGEIRYTNCNQNGCFESCFLACHVKDGKITAIDVGDPVNLDLPREDLGETAFREGMLQYRPCVRGRMWRKTLSHPDRALYPMKNVGRRGEPVWERISWDEALDTIAGKIAEMKEKYGPYSIYGGTFPLDFTPWAGVGVVPWGCSSSAGHQLADALVLGIDDLPFLGKPNAVPLGLEPMQFLNTTLVIAIGWNPAVTHGSYIHALSLAHERGIPIIMIDSRYTVSAHAYADQWIPIRPGTDTALLIGIAYVLFEEDLIDHAFVDRFIEPSGLAKWRSYVSGEVDGVKKSPEWAESICAVPAETIRGLAQLYGQHHGYSDGNPCILRLHWTVARRIHGENAARLGIYLQALTGNIGISGGSSSCAEVMTPFYMPIPDIDWQRKPPRFNATPTIEIRGWADSILLRDKLESGEMSEQEYRRRIGCAQDWPLPNIHMLFSDLGGDVGAHESQKVIAAIKKLDFYVKPLFHYDRPEAAYADIILPMADPFFEANGGVFGGSGFAAPNVVCPGTWANRFYLNQKIIDPPGEARSLSWINSQLAKRLGVLDEFNPRFSDVVDDPLAWEDRFVKLQHEAYDTWRPVYAQWAEALKVEPAEAPSWEEFIKCPIFRVPLKRPEFISFKDQIQCGVPFDTKSGLIEFHSDFVESPEVADVEMVYPRSGVPSGLCFGGSSPSTFPAQAEYVEAWDSPLSEMAQDYPLRLISPHSFFRQHTAQDNNLWIQHEARHALWINVADAKARDLHDGDMARITSPVGEGVLPVYVTSRIAAGAVCMIYGAWYHAGQGQMKTDKMPDGIDMWGSANNFTSGRIYPWVNGNLNCQGLVQVERWNGGEE